MTKKQTKTEEILKEKLDKKFLEMLQCLYGGADQEYEAKKILENFIIQIRQEGYEAGEASMIKNSQGFIEKIMLEKDAVDLIRQQARKETLLEVLKMLPRVSICECKNFPNPKCVQCIEYIGFNSCRSQIKETIDKEMK
mgnify:CR=1 FL=1